MTPDQIIFSCDNRGLVHLVQGLVGSFCPGVGWFILSRGWLVHLVQGLVGSFCPEVGWFILSKDWLVHLVQGLVGSS